MLLPHYGYKNKPSVQKWYEYREMEERQSQPAKKPVNTYQTIRHHIPEDSYLQTVTLFALSGNVDVSVFRAARLRVFVCINRTNKQTNKQEGITAGTRIRTRSESTSTTREVGEIIGYSGVNMSYRQQWDSFRSSEMNMS
jgi:hypothetical protein